MKKAYYLLVIIPILILAFSLVAPNQEKEKPIRMSINPFPGTDYAFIAQEMDFFKKNNVDVKLVLNPSYTETVQLFTDGEVDGAFEVFTDVLLQNANGVNSEIVYVTDYSTHGDVLIGNVTDISELKGKKIGINGISSFSHYFVINSLKKAGIDEKDVFFEIVEETDVVSFLDSGKIQAGHTWEPTKTLALSKNYKVLDEAGSDPGIILDVVVFNEKTIQEHPEQVRAIIKSLVEARDFVYSNKDESAKIMSKIEGFSPEEMSLAMDDAYRPSLKENIAMLEVSNPASIAKRGSDILNFYVERGSISMIPDINKIINDKFVKEMAQ